MRAVTSENLKEADFSVENGVLGVRWRKDWEVVSVRYDSSTGAHRVVTADMPPQVVGRTGFVVWKSFRLSDNSLTGSGNYINGGVIPERHRVQVNAGQYAVVEFYLLPQAPEPAHTERI